jgi:DNA modification methylase
LEKLTYDEFLRNKVKVQKDVGINPDTVEIPEILKPHQKDSLRFALRRGRALLALSFGLGKTILQASLAKTASDKTGQKTLTICPLGVRQEFTHTSTGEPNRAYPADIGIHYQYCTTDSEIENATSQHIITNYERVRDGNIIPDKHNFCLVTMDEASIIGNLGTKTYAQFEMLLKDIPLRYICTATPAPNEYRQLIYYANILGVMTNGEALTRFFGRDVNKAGNLQLLPQYEEEFWLWVSTWALFLYKPSDLGYSDIGYELPELNVYWHRLPVDHTQIWNEIDNHGQYKMLSMASGSINDMHKDKHRTMLDRMAEAKKIIDSYPETGNYNGILLWHDYEYERQEIEKTLHGYDLKTVYGSQDLEKREQAIIDFQDGKYRILATKPVIAGSGCNFQHWSHVNIFLGVSYKFKDFIQSVHRTNRFMQPYPVDLHIIYSESEDHIVSILKEKWEKHNKLTKKMQVIVQDYGLSKKALEDSMQKTLGVPRLERKQTLYTAVNNDNISETRNMAESSVDLIVTSIPFDNHYEYTTVVNDFSFNDNNFKEPLTSGFWEQMDYLTPELLRVLKPGRKAVIHVKDRILYSYQVDHGLTSTFPFSDETVMHFIKHGWVYEGRRTIVTDVVRENNSTYRLGYSEMSKDASKMGSGLPEYLLTFRKPNTDSTKQYADDRIIKIKYDQSEKVFECGNCGYKGASLETDFEFVEGERLYTKYQCPECEQYLLFYSRAKWQIDAHSFWQSNGNILIPKKLYDYEAHTDRMEVMDFKGNLSASYLQEPPESHNDMVWDDVIFMQCLNSNQSRRRVTNHVCPLPLDIVRRAIILYSNFDEVVYDPFAGLFTVPYLAIQLGRIGYGCELNSDYFNDGNLYCSEAEQKRLAPTLFYLLKLTEETN